MQADFRNFYGVDLNDILHSAKGSIWKNHKYIKKENGRYVYPSLTNSGNLVDVGLSSIIGKRKTVKRTKVNDKKTRTTKVEDVEKLKKEKQGYEKEVQELREYRKDWVSYYNKNKNVNKEASERAMKMITRIDSLLKKNLGMIESVNKDLEKLQKGNRNA